MDAAMVGLLFVLAIPTLLALLFDAWPAVRGFGLLAFGGITMTVAGATSPWVGEGRTRHQVGAFSTDLGMVLAAFAVAFAPFGLWQLLVGVVQLFRRGVLGALEAVTLISALVGGSRSGYCCSA